MYKETKQVECFI